MKVIGLTGQTGAGKSTVAKVLTEQGCYHIDADLVARKVIDGDSAVKKMLANHFGEGIIGEDGKILRPELAKRAFANAESVKALNAITHPAVTEKIRSILKEKENEGLKGAIIDAIALFESGENSLCDFTVAVTAPLEIRLERIMKRDGIDRERALERINAQKDEEFFTERCDYIIKNYPPHDTMEQILKITQQI